MKEKSKNKSVAGGFIAKYIVLGIIIGGISFFLENFIPQVLQWDLSSNLAIYQIVLFVISTLLTIFIATNRSLKKYEFESLEEARETAKPVKSLLIIIALFVMIFNLFYCYGIRKAEYKKIEERYEEYKNVVPAIGYVNGKVITGVMVSNGSYELEKGKMNEKNADERYTNMFLNIYLASKEIIIILTYGYAVLYVEKMIECRITKNSKSTKSEKSEKSTKSEKSEKSTASAKSTKKAKKSVK